MKYKPRHCFWGIKYSVFFNISLQTHTSAATQNLRLLQAHRSLPTFKSYMEKQTYSDPHRKNPAVKSTETPSYIHRRLILPIWSSFHTSKYSYNSCWLSSHWQTRKLPGGSGCWLSHKPVLLFLDTKFNCNTNLQWKALGFYSSKKFFQCLFTSFHKVCVSVWVRPIFKKKLIKMFYTTV